MSASSCQMHVPSTAASLPLARKPGSSSRLISFSHVLTGPDMMTRGFGSASHVIMAGQVRRCEKLAKRLEEPGFPATLPLAATFQLLSCLRTKHELK